MTSTLKIIETEDGSHSLYIPELNETYHSFHGALQESVHVFIKSGLEYFKEKYGTSKIEVFEVGFGTGLNALLTLKKAEEHQMDILYHSIEPFPLEKNIYQELNYGRLLGEKKYEDYFLQIHQLGWSEQQIFNSHFCIYKEKTTLQEVSTPQLFDVVYFDAFAPSKQNELWTLEMIEKIYALLKRKGILVTYCAQGQFKRNLKASGFEVEVINGPPGKKEMVRAIKP